MPFCNSGPSLYSQQDILYYNASADASIFFTFHSPLYSRLRSAKENRCRPSADGMPVSRATRRKPFFSSCSSSFSSSSENPSGHKNTSGVSFPAKLRIYSLFAFIPSSSVPGSCRISTAQLFSLPGVLPVTPEFNLGAIITVTLIFLVSATETVGDCSALTAAALRRNPTDKELSGAVTADGLVSSLAGVFGCSPVTSFSQNVGLIAMTGVVNRRAIATGAVVLVLAGFVPVVSLVFASLPEAVLGGCTIMMFGNIIVSGFQMIANAGFSQRNITIAALSLAVGIGFTQMGDIFAIFPELVQSVFADNCVAVVFVVAILASLLLPKDQKVEGPLIVEEGNDSVDAAADALES